MAWTTSACLRARPHLADIAFARLKAAKYLYAVARRAALRVRPGIFLSLSALSLGALAPLLPTNLTAAILLMTGVALAVFGAGANLAVAVSATRKPALPTAPVYPRPAPTAEIPPQPIAPSLPKFARIPRLGSPFTLNHDWAQLMARINHELRTPLNAVIGFSEVMALEMLGPLGNDRYQEYVRHIRDSAGDLLKSAENTLALTALLADPRPAEAVVPCTLEHAIADAWTFVERKAAARDVRLELSLPADIEVLSEPRALRQILVNLLSETIGRTRMGGRASLLAVTDGELVEIVFSVNGGEPHPVPGAGSLAVCLARTLLEMQGTSLLEIESAAGWKAVTVFDRAAQPDFFGVHMPAQTYEAALAI